MESPDLNKSIEQIWRTKNSRMLPEIYVILDAARDKSIYPKILDSEEIYINLFRGDKAIELAEVAPYLVKLELDTVFTKWLLEKGWGNSWGIFLDSPVPWRELRAHFRQLLMVTDEEGKPFFFRYYDPRVFKVYLPTCNREELEIVFGPVERYIVEGDKKEVVEYSFDGNELHVS